MPRSKGSEMPQQRPSPSALLHLKAPSRAESNGVHRPVRDRSPKVEDHVRSPRSAIPEVGLCNQGKRGARVSDLQTRLGHAKEELKKLKEQIAFAENAKRDAQKELEEAKKLIPVKQVQQPEQNGGEVAEVINPVFPSEKEVEKAPPKRRDSAVTVASVVSNVDVGPVVSFEEAEEEVVAEVSGERIHEVKGSVKDSLSDNKPEEMVVTVAKFDPIGCKKEEEPLMKEAAGEVLAAENKLAKEESEIKRYIAENAALKKELEEIKKVAATAKASEEEMVVKVRSLTEELDESRGKFGRLEGQLETVETAKSQLETEMKILKIQTDQWRKAADAAAAIISADSGLGMDYNGNGTGQRMSGRSFSMEKNLGGRMGCDTPRNIYIGTPVMRVKFNEEMGNGKRKSGGIWMLGDLWKKKGNQK